MLPIFMKCSTGTENSDKIILITIHRCLFSRVETPSAMAEMKRKEYSPESR